MTTPIYMKSSKVLPIKVERNDIHGLIITWADGSKCELSSELLRKNCPCATCKEERGDQSHSKPLTGHSSLLKIIEHSKDEQLSLLEVRLVGNYALGLSWADGHTTGIYTFELLNELSKH